MYSRTILLTAIPKDMLSVAKLTEIFGSSAEKVWINRNHKKLQKLVDTRNKDANILENSETKLIKKVNKLAIKKGRKEVPENHEGTITSLYIPDKKRPHHKLGYPVISMLIGKKVYDPWNVFWCIGWFDKLDTHRTRSSQSWNRRETKRSRKLQRTTLRIHHIQDPRRSPSRRPTQTPREETHSLQTRAHSCTETRRSHLVQYGYFVSWKDWSICCHNCVCHRHDYFLGYSCRFCGEYQ